ncbi:DUF1361 domain-containing protein [Paenibacillus paeoniae]|uniref:DUF1361 domain-containing protein n=1 Tax=Paenibacillus paeoniae TaxID=2292705 RepID=A0A371PNK4_9BACL|nr:DUF1361 domain-containing protein [Paenibacillus paeoniae]
MNDRNKARVLFFSYLAVLIATENVYSFMLFNSFLAYAALEISYLLPLFRPKSKGEWPASLLVYLLFLLMSPNVFYIVTDLIHLNFFSFRYTAGLVVREWWNFSLLVTGVLLAIFYYVTMVRVIRNLLAGSRWSGIILFLFVILQSVGIFIGRFLRFHSVHLFTEPFALLREFLNAITRDALIFISLITVLQLLIIWIFATTPKENAHE